MLARPVMERWASGRGALILLICLGCAPDGGDTPIAEHHVAASSSIAIEVIFADATHRVMAVRGSTILALTEGQGNSRLFASSDKGRTWTLRTKLPNGVIFKTMTV